MSKWQNNFAVRISRRVVENRGKVCPQCGESDPLLIIKDGRCAKCASYHKKEIHHLLGKPFRVSKEDNRLVIPVSLNAHRLLSDLQASHELPPSDDPNSESFREACWCELLIGFVELWLVWTYLNEQAEDRQAVAWMLLIVLFAWFLTQLNQFDLSRFVERARIKLDEIKK